jgi:flagellar protein FliT
VTATDMTRLINAYDSLSRTMGGMRAAAEGGDWERLIALESECARLVEQVTALESAQPLPLALRTRKAELIHRVLADDAVIRDLAEPRLRRLGAMLQSTRKEHRLLRAYGPSEEG